MTANMVTDKVYYTDSNGRDFLKRVTLTMISLLDPMNFERFLRTCSYAESKYRCDFLSLDTN